MLLTAILTTNQAGMAESVMGVLAVVVASGLGVLATITARRRPLRFALCVTAVLAASALSTGVNGRLILVKRSFFGVVRVTFDPELNVHRLFHGRRSTASKASIRPRLRAGCISLRSGPIGRLFEQDWPASWGKPCRTSLPSWGLGQARSPATLSRDENWTFYEIDPVIARIAGDRRFFTYLADCRAKALKVVLGDARLRLREAPDGTFGLIVLDASAPRTRYQCICFLPRCAIWPIAPSSRRGA